MASPRSRGARSPFPVPERGRHAGRASRALKVVEIWTDGSAWEGKGGWAAFLVCGRREEVISGYVVGEDVTNNRMELLAAIEALRLLKPAARMHKVLVYSDSANMVNCFRENWIDLWNLRGWQNSRNKPVSNPELWRELDRLVSAFDARFIHVKGHQGNLYNERADALAGIARAAA